MRKIFLVILAGSLLLLFVNAESQAGLNFGVKSLTTHNSIIPLDHSMGSYFGADAGQNLVILAGLDYGRLGIKPEISLGEASVSENMSVSYLQPHAGAKLYFKPRQQGKVSPYVLGEVFKSLASVDLGSLDSSSILGLSGGDIKKAIKDILSPFGIVAGFGSEYYLSENFGIGGEVGLQLAFMSTSIGEGASKVKVSIDRYFIYSGFSFNFKL
jgi:hypothetical protein